MEENQRPRNWPHKMLNDFDKVVSLLLYKKFNGKRIAFPTNSGAMDIHGGMKTSFHLNFTSYKKLTQMDKRTKGKNTQKKMKILGSRAKSF
jgi:hypothetical protein